MPPPPPRRAKHVVVSAAAVLAALVTIAGCASVAQPIPAYEAGWSAVHGGPHGGNAADVDGPEKPDLAWSRDLTAAPTGFAASGPDGQLVVSARTGTGCQMFVFDLDTGRKKWCTWQNPGPARMSPLVDQKANVYVGNIGSADGFDVYGAARWHTPVIGTPRPLQLLRNRSVLVVTHLGQVSVLGTLHGRKLAPSVALAPANRPPPPDQGLDDCADAGPGCPVAFPPAADPSTGDFYFPFRAPGAGGAVLVSMHYEEGAHHGADIHRDSADSDADGTITERWRSRPLPGGVSSAPAISADGGTVYVLDGDDELWALNTHDGTPRWHIALGFDTGNTVSISPDGLIVVGPRGIGPVAAVRDEGDDAAVAWRRTKLDATGPVAIAADGMGYVVTRTSPPRTPPQRDQAGPVMLTTVALGDGRTVSTTALERGTGDSGDVVITNEGRIAVLGAGGLVSVFE